jgi:hypothetical protein
MKLVEVIKVGLRWIRLAKHVARMIEMRNINKILVDKRERKQCEDGCFHLTLGRVY